MFNPCTKIPLLAFWNNIRTCGELDNFPKCTGGHLSSHPRPAPPHYDVTGTRRPNTQNNPSFNPTTINQQLTIGQLSGQIPVTTNFPSVFNIYILLSLQLYSYVRILSSE